MKTAVIYGSTGTGKSVYLQVKEKFHVLYFVDGNPARLGMQIEGLEIKHPESIFEELPDVIIMGQMTGYDDVVSWLIQNGISDDKIICQYVDLPTRARNICLENIAIVLEKTPGAVAELGVYRGDFAKVINKVFPNRTFYLFDTFEGFPEEDLQYDLDNNLLFDKIGKLSNTSVEYVLSRLPHQEKCIVKKGYFPETAEGLEETFVFVNIDADLYKPVLAGLNYFWPRMAFGGYILVHDYFSNAYDGAQKAIEEFSEKEKVGFTPIGDSYSVAFVKK